MSAIDFVVRDDAGAVQRGSLAGADGASSIIVTAGQDVSLNLQRGNILSYVRQGQALQVTLVDGQVLTIEGFFTPEGAQVADLFISANGALSQVDLTLGDGNLLYAQYVDGDSFGKWSPDDDLYFVRGSEVVIAGVEAQDDDAGMLGTALLGGLSGLGFPAAAAAGLGGALLLSGAGGTDGEQGGGSGVNPDGGSGTEPPVVGIVAGTKGADHVVDGEDHADGVEISGTGTPGATGTITVGGVSKDVVIDGNGDWTVIFTPEEIPGGEYEEEVTVIVTNDGGTATTTDTVVLDTTTTVTFDGSTVETDGTINLVEEGDGFTLTGTTEAGASVTVTFGGSDYVATVTGTTWTLNVPAGIIAGGEYDLNVSVTATDTYGNTASTSDTVRVDTVTSVTIDTTTVGGDGTVNMVEREGGITVGGTAQAGASVVVTLAGGATTTVIATSGGTWSADFAAGDFAAGTYELGVTAVATDPAGNTASASGTIAVDTENFVTVQTATVEGDGTVNADERSDGVQLTGTTQPGAIVEVDFAGAIRTVQADASGNWSATFAAASVPTGELAALVKVSSTDGAGNVANAQGTVKIDTVLDVTVNTTDLETDGVVNFVERTDGITLTGTSQPGAAITAVFGGVTVTTTADGAGNWSGDWPASAVQSGEVNQQVNVSATDAAGNTATTSGMVKIDTFVNELSFSTTTVEGDDVVNNAEASDGLFFSGKVERGSTVNVTFGTVTHAATVGADGSWTVNFAASEVPGGTYDAKVIVNATDAAGNTAKIEDTFRVDTEAPAAAEIEGFFENLNGVSMAEIEVGATTDAVSFSKFVDGSGTATPLGIALQTSIDADSTLYRFQAGQEVRDGSHLIVNTADGAGNTNATLFVLEETLNDTVNATSAALDNFNIGAIDMQFANDTELTISLSDLNAMSKNDNSLIVHGGSDDSMTLTGVGTVAAGSTTSINGRTYDIYSLGGDSELIIDSQINLTTTI